MRQQFWVWLSGSLRLLFVWGQYSYQLRRLLPVEVFVQGRYLAAVIGHGKMLHWCRCTFPISVLPADVRLCWRFWGAPGDAWLHHHFTFPK